MSGVQGQVFGHLVRRGFEAAQYHFAAPNSAYVAQLEQDAELYENAGPDMEVGPHEFLPMMITAFIAMLIIASVRYTLGEVIASLTMIESPTSTAIVEDKPPAYADEPDATLEKASLIPSEAEADVEVTLIRNKPITSKITTTLGHLNAVGGFRARWRGIFLSGMYHFAHSGLANFIATIFRAGIIGHGITYVLVSVGLARFHMLWTHSMIAYPSSKPWWRRVVPRKQCKVLLLPSLVFALAQQATFILPALVAFALGIPDLNKEALVDAAKSHQCGSGFLLALRIFAVPVTGLIVGLAVLLPASITLTRIEAALLPEDQETIVPFDRLAIMGDVDLSARGGCRAVFKQAWRSVDCSSRWRLIKLYAKMIVVQVTVAIVALHLVVAEIYLLGAERIALITKSGIAQLQLMAIEAQQNAAQTAN